MNNDALCEYSTRCILIVYMYSVFHMQEPRDWYVRRHHINSIGRNVLSINRKVIKQAHLSADWHTVCSRLDALKVYVLPSYAAIIQR